MPPNTGFFWLENRTAELFDFFINSPLLLFIKYLLSNVLKKNANTPQIESVMM